MAETRSNATNGKALYGPARALLGPAGRQMFNLDIQGAENIPSDGPVVLAANHMSFMDCAVLMYWLDRPAFVLGKSEYLDSWKTRWLPSMGMIPVDRSGKRVSDSLREARDVLDQGGVIGLFPEGTRSRDGMVHAGHAGAAYLAMKTNAALVPVGIWGTDVAQPIGTLVPKRGMPIDVRIGAPIDYAAAGRGATGRAAVTHELMASIAVLARRPYVGDSLHPAAARVA